MRRLVALLVLVLVLLSGCGQWGSVPGWGKNDPEVAREASEQTPPANIQGVTSSKGPLKWDDVLGK